MVATMRVLEDRGIVAKSQGRLSSQPLTRHITGSRTARYITGPPNPDESSSVEMHVLDSSTRVKGADGGERIVEESVPLPSTNCHSLVRDCRSS